MRPLFTVHAGEFLVGQYIESHFKDKHVWVPTKDIGIDLLVTNSANTRATTLQVKFSRDFLPIIKLEPAVLKRLRSRTWFTVDRKHLEKPKAHCWIFVLLGFEESSFDYLIIRPEELLKRLEAIHDERSRRYQVYFSVTKKGRAWLTRGLTKADQMLIATGAYENEERDVTRYLSDWSAIKGL